MRTPVGLGLVSRLNIYPRGNRLAGKAKGAAGVRYKNIVVLTGAGVSAESGVRTFRDNGGLWEEHRVEDVATPEAFARDPDLVQRFYNLRRAQLRDIEPNPAHLALARLEHEFPGKVTVITQNVVI